MRLCELDPRTWLAAALIRALRHVSIALIPLVPSKAFLMEGFSWQVIGGTAAGALALSLLLSIRSLPDPDVDVDQDEGVGVASTFDQVVRRGSSLLVFGNDDAPED